MPGFTFKVKSKQGQQIVDEFGADSPVADLKKRLVEVTGVAEQNLHILTGFPPKKLDTGSETSTLKDIGLVNGDTLIIEDKAGAANANAAAAKEQEKTDEQLAQSLASAEEDEFNGILMKKVVPADNSCLFTSIGKRI